MINLVLILKNKKTRLPVSSGWVVFIKLQNTIKEVKGQNILTPAAIMTTHTKYELGFFPTPLQELKNFSALFQNDYQIFIKRDDHTGLATGGNKTRKLEYLLGEAMLQGADSIITAGAQQSNHCRQTAAACAQAGLTCHLLLGGDPPDEYNGNLLLSGMLGANIHFTGKQRKGEDLEMLAKQLKEKGLRPYIIPYGGSNLTGAMGYVEAAGELKDQLQRASLKMDYIFFASSSGGMQAGLILGMAMHGLSSKLMPVQIDKDETQEISLQASVAAIVRDGFSALELKGPVDTAQTHTIRGYEEAGYGVVTHQEKEAITTLARSEGIILDPVYTGRAFYGMMDHLRTRRIKPGANVLFWHTGGIPANFHYAEDLAKPGLGFGV